MQIQRTVQIPECSSCPAFSELLVAVLATYPSIRDDLHGSAKDE